MEKDDKKDAHDEGEKEKGSGEEGEGGEEGLNPPKKKLSPKMMIIIGVAALLLLGGGGAGLYFAGVFGGGAKQEMNETTAAHGGGHGETKTESKDAHGGGGEGGGEEGEAAAPKYFSLGDILVNLSGDGKRPNFLKIKVSLELANEKDVAALESLKPRIIDNFQVYLRELRIEDLKGSAGLYRLREELLLRVTEVVQPIRVRDVLFQEMLVQ